MVKSRSLGIHSILIATLICASGCRKKSDTDEASDVSGVTTPVVVSGGQPVTGGEGGGSTVFVTTNADGSASTTLADTAVGLSWASAGTAFTATEDTPFSAASAVREDDAAFEIGAPSCGAASWNPALAIDEEGTVTGTPLNDSVGSCVVRVTATKGSEALSRDLTIQVQNVDDAPTWTTLISDFSLAEGEALDGITVEAADVDSTIAYSLDAANMTCDDGAWDPPLAVGASSGALSGAPSAADIGSCTIRIRATAGGVTIQTPPVTVVVADVPVPPTWIATASSQTIAEDAAFSVTVTAADADGDTIAYSLDLPNMTCDDGAWSPALEVNPTTGALTGTPTNGDIGSCTVRVIAASLGDSIVNAFTLTIANSNDAPTWNPVMSDFTLSHTSTLTGRFAHAVDVDPGAVITYSVVAADSTCDDLGWTVSPSINATTGELAGDPGVGNVGETCSMRIRATSGGDSIDDDVVISVVASSTPPSWNSIVGDRTLNEDANLSTLGLAADATDPDSAPTYALDLAQMTCDDGSFSPQIAVDIATGALSGTPTNADVGSCTVKITASSGGDSITQSFTLTVSNTNDLPTWASSIGNFSMNEATALAKTAVASDLDPGASVTYSLDLAAMTCDNGAWSPGVAVNATSGAISGTPAHSDVGSCTIKVVATSGADSISETFTVTILDVTSPSPPGAATTAAYTSSASTSPTLSWSASPSAPGDVHHYSVSLGTSAGGTQVVSGVDVGTSLTHQFTGQSFTECSTYFGSVKAVDASGNQSTAALANQAFRYDGTAPGAPTSPGLSGDATTTASPTLAWTPATDNCGGAVTYEVAVGLSAGAADVVGWTSTSGSSRQLTGIALSVNTDYYMSVRSVDGAGHTSASVSGAAFRVLQTATRQVVAGSDDAEEYTNGTVSLTSTDLEMVDSAESSLQKIGIRFTNLGIPQGAVIKAAYIQFETDEATSTLTTLDFWAEDVDDASTFTTAASNVSSRVKTTATVSWSGIAAWNTVGEAGASQRSPDLKSIAQEIVDRGGWSSGNDMVFIVSGTGKRVAKSFNLGSGTDAPILTVEFY